MKIAPLILAILTGLAIAGDEKPSKATVAVYTEYEHTSSDAVRSGLESEVGSILSPLGFDVRWRDASRAGTEVWADLAMIRFHGDCDPRSKTYPLFAPGPLGWTQITDGIIQPFADINCDRIGGMIQGVSVHAGERLFARAVGRVVAHELYHIFVKTSVHEGSGIGKPEFTTRDLLSDRFTFHPVQAHALRVRCQNLFFHR